MVSLNGEPWGMNTGSQASWGVCEDVGDELWPLAMVWKLLWLTQGWWSGLWGGDWLLPSRACQGLRRSCCKSPWQQEEQGGWITVCKRNGWGDFWLDWWKLPLHSANEQHTFHMSLALVPGVHSVHEIGMSPSLIILFLKCLLSVCRMLLGTRDRDEQDKDRCDSQQHGAKLNMYCQWRETNIHAAQPWLPYCHIFFLFLKNLFAILYFFSPFTVHSLWPSLFKSPAPLLSPVAPQPLN